MTDFTARVLDLHRQQAALRGDCGILSWQLADPNIQRLVEDLRHQHARQTAEVAALLGAAVDGSASAYPAEPDAVAGDEHAAATAADPAGPASAYALLEALVQAEMRLREAYDLTAQGLDHDSPAFSLLQRHRVALDTALQRLRMVASTVSA